MLRYVVVQVLELWDRSYQYWILKQEGIGPKVNQVLNN